MKRIYIIHGGFLGADGVVTSAGTELWVQKLADLGVVKGYLQEGYEQCVRDITDDFQPGDIVIIIGYSGGAVMATIVCNELKPRKVSQLICLDGSPAHNMRKVGVNVERILDITNSFPHLGLGAGTTPYTSQATEYHIIPIQMPHLEVQASQGVYDIVRKTIAAL